MGWLICKLTSWLSNGLISWTRSTIICRSWRRLICRPKCGLLYMPSSWFGCWPSSWFCWCCLRRSRNSIDETSIQISSLSCINICVCCRTTGIINACKNKSNWCAFAQHLQASRHHTATFSISICILSVKKHLLK